jgi:cell division protein FtsB
MKALVIIGVILLLGMQYRVWFGDSGYFKRQALAAQLEEQLAQAREVEARNEKLIAEVQAFRVDAGLPAVEARARAELGMVRAGETFFLIVDP